MTVQPTPEQIADRLGYLKAKQAELAAEVRECQKAIEPFVAGGKTVRGHRFQITLSVGSSMRLDSARLKADMPGVIAQYQKVSPFKRFNVNALSQEAAA